MEPVAKIVMPETDIVFFFLQSDRLTEIRFLATVAMIALVALVRPAAGIFSPLLAEAHEPVKEVNTPGAVASLRPGSVRSPVGAWRDSQKVNVPDMVVMPSTEASTRAVVWWVSASTCIRHPG